MAGGAMSVVWFTARMALLLPLLVVGLLCVAVVYPLLSVAGRCRLNRRWSRLLLAVCGIRVRTAGVPILEGPVLYVANHVSWIDIFVMNSIRATAFIAKSEIRAWPVIGYLVAGAGTLFIQRGQRHAVHAVSEAMQARFAQGEALGLFPEGTTSVGDDLLPFHASLFEPVRFASVPVQPLAMQFRQHGKRSSTAAFVGEETLVANLWRVLGSRGLSVDIIYLPPLDLSVDGAPAMSQTTAPQQTTNATRAAATVAPRAVLAERARQAIARGLNG